jgi:hypothetical protein
MSAKTTLGLIAGAIVLSAASATIAAKIAAPHTPTTTPAATSAHLTTTATPAPAATPAPVPAAASVAPAPSANTNPNLVMVSTANRRMLIVNVTNHTLTNLYASSVNDPSFHADWLGDRVLAPGESAIVNFEDGTGACMMDVKGVFSDGGTANNSYNVCAETEIDFTGN